MNASVIRRSINFVKSGLDRQSGSEQQRLRSAGRVKSASGSAAGCKSVAAAF
jgi:hypothetical protein